MLTRWLRKGKPAIVGIDIGSSTVKLLEIESQNASRIVKSHAIISLTPETIIGSEIKNPQALAEALSRVKTESHTQADSAAIAVAGSAVVSKLVKLDAGLSETDMESQAWIEASKHFPDLIDNVSLDFEVLGFVDDDPTRVNVLLIACRNENINSRIEPITHAGLTTKIVDVDNYALARACNFINKNETTVALLNVSGAESAFIVVSDGELIFSRNQTFNSQFLINTLRDQLSSNEDGLFDLLLKFMELPEADKAGSVQMIASEILGVIQQSIQYFEAAGQKNKIDHLYLSGLWMIVPDILNALTGQVSVEMSVAKPFEDVLKKVAPAFMLSSGLALRGCEYDTH